MYARTFGATTQGVDGLIISVEVDSANGMPSFDAERCIERYTKSIYF